MQIILLSGGSGTRLWPLSNDARSKQFLKVLPICGSDKRESMIQRVVRQMKEANISASLTVATSESQKDSVLSQIGNGVDIVTEPCRRDTFPAICLACEYLSKEKHCSDDEIVVVMPCDPYTEMGYFQAIAKMTEGIGLGLADMMVMGIKPTYPSSKYGYVVPDGILSKNGFLNVKRFTEKPDVTTAEKLIGQGAMWNGGVFAFRLGYITKISDKYLNYDTFSEYIENYSNFPKISFDYEVAEKAESIGMVLYDGKWKDLGTWNTLTDELDYTQYGNVITDGSGINTHIFNELNIPLLCLGTNDLVVAASPDGIIVAEKKKSEYVKEYAAQLKRRPMYEEKRWGKYTVLDSVEFPSGYSTVTKRITLNPNCSTSYQRHKYSDKVWTFINGQGEIVLDGEQLHIAKGDTIFIPKGQLHALKAATELTFIEVQNGQSVTEEDIERFNCQWH